MTARPPGESPTGRDGSPVSSRDWSPVALGCGLLSASWAIVMLLPSVADLPAWPAASVGILALVTARLPGRGLWRGFGAFLGFVGLVVGSAKILALWGLLEILE